MGTRIKDIAESAGVSSATVSLVLNNKPGVGEKTRERILDIARTMDYCGDKQALLSKYAGATIRFLRISRHGHVVNNDHSVFIANYIDGLSQMSRELGLHLEVLTIADGSIESIVEQASDEHIQGCIVLGTELPQEDIIQFRSVKTPIVFLDTYDDISSFDYVDMNNKDSVFMAVARFFEKGHREIGIVTSDVTTRNFKLRTDAFKEALAAVGLPFRKEWLFNVDSTFQGAYTDILAALDEGRTPPKALFCINDIVALGAMRAFKERDLSIPDDISIIGFDNLPAGAMSDPPLTTINVSKIEIGRFAVHVLFERIKADYAKPAVKILVGGELIDRRSVLDLNTPGRL
jgi:LacI family transcriptional regulator